LGEIPNRNFLLPRQRITAVKKEKIGTIHQTRRIGFEHHLEKRLAGVVLRKTRVSILCEESTKRLSESRQLIDQSKDALERRFGHLSNTRAEAQPKADQPSPHGVGESVRSPVADPAEVDVLNHRLSPQRGF
jgi:hypothetical protein